MFLKSLIVGILATATTFASAATYKIETKEGVKEIISLLGDRGPGCAMGKCGSIVSDLKCGWSLDGVGKIYNGCAFKDESDQQYVIADLEAYKIIAYLQVAGIKLDDSVPGLMQTPKVKTLECKIISAQESYVCEFNL